jgi:hypothetical protein
VSDYLSDLVARTFDLESAVRPLLSSIFEPASIPHVAETEQVAKAPAVGAAPAKTADSPVRGAQPAPQPRAQATEPSASSREVSVEIETEKQPAREQVKPMPAETVVATEVRREIVERVDRSMIERHTRELREIAIESSPPPGAPAGRPDMAAQRLVPPVPAIPMIPVSPVNPAGRAPPVGQPELPAEEPSAVRVTIGRVEVRAIFPPAATLPKPKSPPAPAVSLEEYLKEESRRGR